MKVLVKSAWGSDDPTKAAFPFLHENVSAESVQQVHAHRPVGSWTQTWKERTQASPTPPFWYSSLNGRINY